MSERSAARYQIAPSYEQVASLKPWFLSLTIDTSVLIGGRWWGTSRGTRQGLAKDRVTPLDLADPRLLKRASPFAGSLLRVGGTEADRIRYGFAKDGEPSAPRQNGAFVLKSGLWRRINTWAAEAGFQLLFTVSAGPESRDAGGAWDPRDAERLIRNTGRHGYPVTAWEFGNEVNAYPFLYGWRHSVSARRYASEFRAFADLVRRYAPGSRTVGPASAIWPVVGEPNPLIPSLARSPEAAHLDVLSFHYYPQQSSRGAVAVRRARSTNLLNARALDGATRWIRYAQRALAVGAAAHAPLWLTEAGHALYGGQPGVSDTSLSTPWWLDQLGQYAHAGVEAVFRQSLVGGDYGLLESDFSPRPDWFASLLWKTHMGPKVFAKPLVTGPDRRLRVWHHGGQDSSCLLLINLHRRRSAAVEIEGTVTSFDVLDFLGDQPTKLCWWNRRPLWGDSGASRVLEGPEGNVPAELTLPPLSCAFVTLKGRPVTSPTPQKRPDRQPPRTGP